MRTSFFAQSFHFAFTLQGEGKRGGVGAGGKGSGGGWGPGELIRVAGGRLLGREVGPHSG